MNSTDVKRMKEIFHQSQFSVTSHERLCKQLRQLYEKNSLDSFSNEYIKCLQVPLIQGEKFRPVENILSFASKFIASHLQSKPVPVDVEEEEREDEEISPFALNVLKFLFENHNSDYQAIRFRVCQFINRILNGLGNEACIDDDLCDQISECMMERLQDKAPAVRMQAVLALHRLQDPADASCPVMKAFMFHMSSDPSAEVRRAVLTNIAITAPSVRGILERTHDIKDTVRRSAFLSLSKLSVQRFTIIQRVRLLTDGLKDHAAIVRDAVSKAMLPAWLQFYKGSFLSLLHALDCENATEISSIALRALFKSEPMKAVLEELTNLLNEDKVIPIEELSPENVLYWRLLSEYLEAHPEIADDRPIDEPLPELLPELSTFCNYIKQYHDTKSLAEAEHWVVLQHQYILIQLLELCKGFDLADEMGRTNLKDLCLYFLTNNSVPEIVVPVIIQLMVRIVPQVEDRLQALAEAISEVREPMTEQEAEPEAPQAPPLSADEQRQKDLKQASIRVKINELKEEQDDAVREKNYTKAQKLQEECETLQCELKTLMEGTPALPPPPTRVEIRDSVKDELALRKCLRIVREMTQSDSVKSLSATLRSLMQNFILPCLEEERTPIIRNKALEVLGIFSLLDKTLAKENFFMFCFQIANDEVCEVALKVTFDLLLQYGLETFQILEKEENGEVSTKKKTRKKKNLFPTDMCDDDFDTEEDESQETQTTFSSGSSGNTSNLISMLTSLLDSASTSMRNLAMVGLYKLLMACRITSSALLSRLILMWYSPVTDGDESLRQPLSYFLTLYASQCPRSQETLEQAFMPTLRTLMQAPVTSPLTQIDKESVSRLLLNLTRPGINKYHSKMSHIHNNLALTICNAILDCDDSTNVAVLLKALSALELSLDDAVYREELKTLVKRVREIFNISKEKLFIRSLDKIRTLIELAADNVSMRTTEVDNTAASSQLEATQSVRGSIQCNDTNNRNIEGSHPHTLVGDSDDEDTYHTTTSNIIIPPSPPRDEASDGEEMEKEESEEQASQIKEREKEDVFKKPATNGKSMRSRTRNRGISAAPGDNDTSPVAKRKKADETQVDQIRKSRFTKSAKAKEVEGQLEAQSATSPLRLAQKTNSPTVTRNARNLRKENDTSSSIARNIQSGKRQINPTEKGSTLKTFQNITPPTGKGSDALATVSPRLTPPSKRIRKSLPSEVSSTADSSTQAQTSEVSGSFSTSNDSPARPNTRRSIANRTDRDSLESPPVSAAQLRSKMEKNANKGQKSTIDKKGLNSNGSSPCKSSSGESQIKNSNEKKKTPSSDDSSTPTSCPEVDAVSSTIPKRNRNAKGDAKQSGKILDTQPRTTRSKTESDESPLRETQARQRSGRSKIGVSLPEPVSQGQSRSVSDSVPSDSDSSPAPLPPNKQKKLKSQNAQENINKKTTSASSTDVESDISPVRMAPRQKRREQVKGIEKLPERSMTSVPTRATRRSTTSQSDSEGTPQPSNTSYSDQSPALHSRALQKEDKGQSPSPSSAAQLKQKLLKKNVSKEGSSKVIPGEKSEESDSVPSPTTRSSRGKAAIVSVAKTQPTKKRPAEALKSTSSEGLDSDSSPSVSKVKQAHSKSKGASNNSTPVHPEKKTRTKTPSIESLPARRSLRSSVETPSPRTRSGKVKI